MSASLFPYINQDRCYGSNIASTSTSGELTRLILRAHDTRHETDDEQSLMCIDDDSGLLITVAFSELVRIRQILVTAATADERIDNVKVWANRVDPPSLEEAEDGSMKPDQEFRLLDGERECVEYPVRVARFSSVSTVTLYLHSFRPSPQRLFYLGFMGEAMTYRKDVRESVSIGAQNTADSVVHGMKEKYGSASSTIR